MSIKGPYIVDDILFEKLIQPVKDNPMLGAEIFDHKYVFKFLLFHFFQFVSVLIRISRIFPINKLDNYISVFSTPYLAKPMDGDDVLFSNCYMDFRQKVDNKLFDIFLGNCFFYPY